MDGAGVGAETATNALFVVDLQIQTVHVQGHLGANADASGASQALLLVVNELLHICRNIKNRSG